MPPDHPDPHGSRYGNNLWMGMGYSQPGSHSLMSPIHDYHGYDFHHVSAPMEPTTLPTYSMPRPPPYASTTPHIPPPLIMPTNGLWPSMIATQSHGYQTPILPATGQTPISASAASDITPTSAKTTSSRRKLTDEERRQMCLEAEQNPTMKQTQIGAKFNVERSTVSKILRQKDKYMNPSPKEEVTSPDKKSKAKLPDFEKTLTNWVKNQQRKGVPISDGELRKQARVFSFSRSDQALLSSPSWLETFKQKNNLSSNETSNADSDQSTPPIDESPVSSNGLVSPPMTLLDQKQAQKEQESDEYVDYDIKASYSTSSALHLIGEEMEPTIMSPMSPELNRDETLTAYHSINTANRQRSQTFSYLPETNPTRPSLSGPAPHAPVRSLTSTTTIRTLSVDPRQTMKRHKSVPDIHDSETVKFSSTQPPPLPNLPDLSPILSPISNPGSPVDDDNIRALHTIKELLESNPHVAEADDYLAIGKLMEKLKLIRKPVPTSMLQGGMHPPDMLDAPRLSRKRTIMGIST